MPKVPRLYTSISGAAEIAGVSPKTIRRRIACGDLPAFRTGRLIRVKLDDVENAMMRPIPTVGAAPPLGVEQQRDRLSPLLRGDGEPPGGVVAPSIRREHESRGRGSATPKSRELTEQAEAAETELTGGDVA